MYNLKSMDELRDERGKEDSAMYAEQSSSRAQRLENAAWACAAIAVGMYLAWQFSPFILEWIDMMVGSGGQ